MSDRDLDLKSFFLGPQSENSDWFLREIIGVLQHTFDWRKSRFPSDGYAIHPTDQTDPSFIALRNRIHESLRDLLGLLESETPKFTPRYNGHMVSETSLPALLAQFAMLLHNPNNASREASHVGLAIECEAINDLAEMIGFDRKKARGHFTSGGTLANYEALWRALYRLDQRGARKGAVLLVPGSKHYSWPKAATVFGLGSDSVWSVALDEDGRLNTNALRASIARARREEREIAMVVSVAGTTELGEIDPVDVVQDVLDEEARQGSSLWHHVDAAYGGFFSCIRGSENLDRRVQLALNALKRVDSVTLDPHKLGYIPYACGAFLAADAARYECYRVDAPYLREEEPTAPGWATTLEGSRSAAGAAAVWLTARTLEFNDAGFGRILESTLTSRREFSTVLAKVEGVRLVRPADTNVVCFAIANDGDGLSQSNEKTSRLFEAIESGPEFNVSRTRLLRENYGEMISRLCREWNVRDDGSSELFVIRLVLMNPFSTASAMRIRFAEAFADRVSALI